MTQHTLLLDPTAERAPSARTRLARPSSLDGATVGLLDISKARGNEFLDRMEERLSALSIAVKRYSKPTFTRIAPTPLKQQIASECQVVVEGLAD
jgi:hypothetical protein